MLHFASFFTLVFHWTKTRNQPYLASLTPPDDISDSSRQPDERVLDPPWRVADRDDRWARRSFTGSIVASLRLTALRAIPGPENIGPLSSDGVITHIRDYSPTALGAAADRNSPSPWSRLMEKSPSTTVEGTICFQDRRNITLSKKDLPLSETNGKGSLYFRLQWATRHFNMVVKTTGPIHTFWWVAAWIHFIYEKTIKPVRVQERLHQVPGNCLFFCRDAISRQLLQPFCACVSLLRILEGTSALVYSQTKEKRVHEAASTLLPAARQTSLLGRSGS